MSSARKRLVIIGASAMGREACHYAWESGYEVKGFLDSRPGLLDNYAGYPPILAAAEQYNIKSGDVFICAVGSPEQKRKYVEMFTNADWISLVHPTAYVGKSVKLGSGCIICPNVTLTADISIGHHVIVNGNASISHDCTIGDYVTVSPGCNIAGWCTIGNNVFVGAGAVLIPHVSLGDGVYVAASAAVTKSFSSGRLMGVPAVIK